MQADVETDSAAVAPEVAAAMKGKGVKPRFITFEGIDGAGKSTHIATVADLARARGMEVVVTREPGGTAIGESLRGLLLAEAMHLETETLLMFAARREHVAQVIAPALARGAWVISDRFTDATFAYQGGGRGVPAEKIQALADWVHPGLTPDLTLLFDLPREVAAGRMASSRALDRFEIELTDFHERVRAEYLRRAAAEPHRFRIIDANLAPDQISKVLEKIVSSI
jgi:dTMP kinase